MKKQMNITMEMELDFNRRINKSTWGECVCRDTVKIVRFFMLSESDRAHAISYGYDSSIPLKHE